MLQDIDNTVEQSERLKKQRTITRHSEKNSLQMSCFSQIVGYQF